MVGLIREDLGKIGVEFDNWFSERTLYDNGEYNEALGQLREGGYLSQREDALWFNSTMLGDEKDNVVVRSSGEPTYFASDIAYHHNKFTGRGFDSVVNIWGADHQGHVTRLKAALEGLGIDPAKLTILIAQMVTLKRGSEVVRASKRAGEFVTLRELADEVGKRRLPILLPFQNSVNADGVRPGIGEEGIIGEPGLLRPVRPRPQRRHPQTWPATSNIDWSKGDVSLLNDPSELALVRAMLRLPELVQQMAESLEPHHLAHYTMELATAFHGFYENCRVISANPEDADVTLARLKLVESAQIVFRRSLDLMGMAAPERM